MGSGFVIKFTAYNLFRVAVYFLPVFWFRCLATANIIQVQDALVFTEVQSAGSFRSGLTPIALQFHPQTTMPDYLHRDYRQE